MRTTKENLLKKILLTLVIFLSSFINPSDISADVCDPWTCNSPTAFSVVDECGYNGVYCFNANVVNYTLNCDAGTCSGDAPGVDGCLGNTPVTTSTDCTCSEPGTCSSSSINGSVCGTAPYLGVCQDCVVNTSCGESGTSSRSCCDNSALPPPTEDPNPTAIPEPTSTPLSCDSACTTDTQCTDV
ncbi:hypothetical protein KKD03_02775, partial [Patescibacteria group bacterium]|nr:hypothetical protein [Patescibacteria group bacterium]